MRKPLTLKNGNQSTYKVSRKFVFIGCGTFLGIVAILMTIAAFFDYQIDWILAKPFLPEANPIYHSDTGKSDLGFVYTSSVFGRIIEIIGTGPCIICTVIALMIFHQNAYKIKMKGWRLTVQISSVLVAIMWIIYSCFFQFFPLMVVSIVGVQSYGAISPLQSNGFVNNANTALLYLVFGAVFSAFIIVPSWLILRRVEKQTMSELLRYAFILTSASIICILLVEIAIKPTLQRERFRFLMAYGNVDVNDINNIPMWTSTLQYSDNGTAWYWAANGTYNHDPNGGFHPWYALPYTPYGYGSVGNLPFISEDSSKSFPSGHETMAAVGFYSLAVLPFTVRKFNTKKWKIILFSTAIIGSGIVAFGRLVAGAHYLSDVTIGSVIAIVCLLLFSYIYVKRSPHLDSWCNLKLSTVRSI